MSETRFTKIIRPVYHTVRRLLEVDRFYALHYDAERQQIECLFCAENGAELPPWPARPWRGATALPDRLLEYKDNLLYEQDAAAQLANEGLTYWPEDETPPASWLGAPLLLGNQVSGALVVENREKERAFGLDGLRVLATIARQAALALENARLDQRLDRKIDALSVLHRVGQKITASFRQEEREILRLLYAQADHLPMDTHNMHFALYDAAQERLTTELAILDKKEITPGAMPEGQTNLSAHGLIGWIIQQRKPVLIATQAEASRWQQGHHLEIDFPLASWVGVPMIAGDEVIGAIAAFHPEEHMYEEDDQEVLEILASQAAAAIQNKRLYERWESEQENARAAQQMALMSGMAAEFAHRLNNVAGTIPVWVDMARDLLDGSDKDQAEVLYLLGKINVDSQQLMDVAQVIDHSTKPTPPELVDLNKLLETATDLAIAAVPGGSDLFSVEKSLAPNLPQIYVERNKLEATLRSVLKNGLEAMPEGGCLAIESKLVEQGRFVQIVIADTGAGIPSEDLPKIFELFYSTKGSLGFGLWRDKAFLTQIGGDIQVQSQMGQGSKFTLKVPARTDGTA